jgi:tripartite-type tricarboxylate transporter receptor subunit TctC
VEIAMTSNSNSFFQLSDLTRRETLIAAATALSLGALPASAQVSDWPSKQPIKFIVGYPAGGSADVVGRLFAEHLSKTLGQTTIIENKSGAGGTIGALSVVRADPDGYTFYVPAISEISLAPATVENLPYDPTKDFEPVAILGKWAQVLVTAPNFPPNTLKELIAYAKENPGKVSYSSFGNNTLNHLNGERFKLEAGIDTLHVPYRGSAGSIADLMGGQVQYTFDSPAVTLNLVQAGKIKAIAVAGPERIANAPDIPTTTEAGLPGFHISSWIGLLAPANTPKAIINKMNAEVNAAIKSSALRATLDKSNIVPGGGTPEEFGKQIQAEITQWRTIAPKIGIKPTK